MTLLLLILFVGLLMLAVTSFFYPVLLAVLDMVRTKRVPDETEPRVPDDQLRDRSSSLPPSVSIVVPVHEAALDSLGTKLINLRHLNYPIDRLQVLIAGDGLGPHALTPHLDAYPGADIDCFASTQRLGKNETLNRTVARATGEILVFSDVDSRLDANAIAILAEEFLRPDVGGVRGQQVLVEDMSDDGRHIAGSQRAYWKMEDFIRAKEMSLLGSVTSNTGAICAMRRDLFEPIPMSATDDLFIALTVISKGFAFVAGQSALAYIAPPSKSQRHEMDWRRRIVTRSLGSMWHRRDVFLKNPSYGVCLFVHKVLRRLIPLILIMAFLVSLGLHQVHPMWGAIIYAQVAAAGLCLLTVLVPRLPAPASHLRYFVAAGWATALGVFDFLVGRSRPHWE